MRLRVLLPALAAIAGASPPVAAVAPGDFRAQVLLELGEPEGSVRRGATEVLYFDRGEVWLRDGVVVSAAIRAEDEQTARLAAEAAGARWRAEAAARRSARLEARGRAVLAERERDPAFLGLPAAERLRLWREFSVRYPMVPVANRIERAATLAAADEAAQAAREAEEARLVELEARVAAAEARAARAEQEARRARGGGWFVPFWGRPGHRYGWDGRPGGDRNDDGSPAAGAPPARDPMDAARGDAMGGYEASRRTVYRQAGP